MPLYVEKKPKVCETFAECETELSEIAKRILSKETIKDLLFLRKHYGTRIMPNFYDKDITINWAIDWKICADMIKDKQFVPDDNWVDFREEQPKTFDQYRVRDNTGFEFVAWWSRCLGGGSEWLSPCESRTITHWLNDK